MKTMAAGKFKDVCLKTLDEVANTKTVVVITKRGRPVAKLLPIVSKARPHAKAGVWKGRTGFGLSDSFFDPLPEDELALWNGEGD